MKEIKQIFSFVQDRGYNNTISFSIVAFEFDYTPDIQLIQFNGTSIYRWTLSELIFDPDHKFLKAFFGDSWKINAQELVVSDDRISYLTKYIFKHG